MIRQFTAEEVIQRIRDFDARYVEDWNGWLRISRNCRFETGVTPFDVAKHFKHIMGKWQACRPRPLRTAIAIKQTLEAAGKSLAVLESVDLRSFQSPARDHTDALSGLWRTLEEGLCLDGEPTEVGVSKAILLLTKGRFGPAFDSSVKTELDAHFVKNSETYVRALAAVANDLAAFESDKRRGIEEFAKDAGRPAAVGRIVDMLLGPRRQH